MTTKYWKVLVILVGLITIISFLFIFQPDRESPYLLHLPYIFWTGILTTITLVICTYLGARFFPYKEKDI